jgi:hypothetical protein
MIMTIMVKKMGRYDNLYPRPERIRRAWGIGVVDALNELYGWLTDGTHDINVNSIYAIYGNFAYRPYAEGRPVILDGDPINIYKFYDLAETQITEAIDKSSLLSKAVSDLDQIYGKLTSASDITSSIDNAKVTSYSLDIREYARRTTEAVETYAPKLATIEEYTRKTRDVMVRMMIDEYGNVGVRIAEPLDEYGRVSVSPPKEILDEFKPVSTYGSISASDNTYGFSVVLVKGGRPNVNIYYSLGGAGTVYLKASTEGVTWRTLKSYSLAGAGEGVDIIQGIAYPYVRLETPTTGIGVEFEIVASR